MNDKAKKDWLRIRSVFEDALQQPAKERRVYAQDRCGTNEILWNEVSSLLNWHERSESFLEMPAVVQVIENDQLHDQLIAGQRLLHYEIRKLIGKGGMGEVYLAHDDRLDRNVAIKLLRRDLLPHIQGRERLLREARAVALLEHPNICHIYEISEVDGFSFIVMQYVVGTTLDYILARGGTHVDAALDLGAQIAQGLAEAHSQGIIHRDIKPANIIVSEKGQPKILDFGLAKFIEAEGGVAENANRIESSSGVMGTVPYMSPEQLLDEAVDARTDVFSFGTMLFEMFSGVPTFGRENNAETISAILKEEPDWSLISPILRPVLKRCLAKDQGGRYASAGELAEAIVKVRSGGPIENPTRSNTTGPNRIDAVTVADLKTLPLYLWHSGGDEIALPSSGPHAERWRLFDSPWLIPFAVAGPLLVLLAIGLINISGERASVSTSSSGPAARSSGPTVRWITTLSVRNQMAAIPGGTFSMGRRNGRYNETPEHQVTVKPFSIDKTEVTNAEYYEFVQATRYSDFPNHWVNGKPLSGDEMAPVRFVNIEDINNFIGWRSEGDNIRYRLPTEQEWEFAARNGGLMGNLYPWGNTFDPKCAYVDQSSSQPTVVGSRTCPNQWGVMDLIGNVAEWTSSTTWLYPDSKGRVILPTSEARYMVRGGSAFDKSTGHRAATSTVRIDVPASMRNASLGFRLVTTKGPSNTLPLPKPYAPSLTH